MKDFEISTILKAKFSYQKYPQNIDINTFTVANLEFYYNERVTLEIEVV